MVYMKNLMVRMNLWIRYGLELLSRPTAILTNPPKSGLTDIRDQDILYRSEQFIVVNKRCFVVMYSDPIHHISLAKQLAYKFPEAVDPTIKCHFR